MLLQDNIHLLTCDHRLRFYIFYLLILIGGGMLIHIHVDTKSYKLGLENKNDNLFTTKIILRYTVTIPNDV